MGEAGRQTRGARRRIRAASALAAGALAMLSPARPTAQPSLELAVKATDLYKFAAFIGWPAAAFEGPASPARLCVAGDDPFGGLLDQAVRGQSLGAHPITVTRLERVERGAACHILFLGPSRRQTAAEALDQVRGSPVLTVTDSAKDPAGRGMIDFVLRDNRVRFRVDARAAEQAGLSVSSKLLGVAVKP